MKDEVEEEQGAASASASASAADDAGAAARVGTGSEDRVKGPWSPEEDAVLSRLVSKFGARNWSLIARGISGRSGKSCRLRWCNQLDPSVKRKPFSGLVCCFWWLSSFPVEWSVYISMILFISLCFWDFHFSMVGREKGWFFFAFL